MWRRCACSAEKNLTKGQVMLDKDLAEIYDYKGQKLEADILICTPFYWKYNERGTYNFVQFLNN